MTERAKRPMLQFSRYLLIGGFNTVFGYGVFALLNWLFRGLGAYSYLYAAIPANVIVISVAFLGYKWFVFKTKGNYLIEWVRCFGVYGLSALVGLAALPILVWFLRPRLSKPASASYIAAALVTGMTVLFSFFGHKNISFAQTLGSETNQGNGGTPAA
jgi:putative flippase GtrA